MAQRRPRTRQGEIQALVAEGRAGLLPWEQDCSCPKRGGPDHPRPGKPGMVGYRTCDGCRFYKGPYINSQVCTHVQAHQTAAQWLGNILKPLEEPKPELESEAQIVMF